LSEAASHLLAYYYDDIVATLAEELVHLAALFSTILDKQKANLDHRKKERDSIKFQI